MKAPTDECIRATHKKKTNKQKKKASPEEKVNNLVVPQEKMSFCGGKKEERSTDKVMILDDKSRSIARKESQSYQNFLFLL